MASFEKYNAHIKEWRDITYNEHKVMDAWERRLTGDGETSALSNVRSIIHESWDRSISKGINAQYESSPQTLDKYQLEERKEKFLALLQASRQSFSNMGKLLNGTNAILILADSEGNIIDQIGDKATMFAGRDINLTIGGNWNEEVIGTNGIGTALCTGKPVFVHAAEHFCLGIKGWSCAGAPIHDPRDGSVLGVIDLSGPSEIFQPYTCALIAEAAREIEEALAQRNYKDQLKLLEAFFDQLNHVSHNEDLILLDQFGRVAFCQGNAAHRSDQKKSLYPGTRLINVNFDDQITDGDISSALPETLRDCKVNLLQNDGVKGAMLIFENKLIAPKLNKKKQGSAKVSFSHPYSATKQGEPEIIGQDPSLCNAIETVRRLANSSAQMALLVEGETGVGKELFAKLIHSILKEKSEKAPLVTLNCGAIAKDLFGGELFGHEAGSFTGALKDGKPGKFEMADGGVLCLDEIGELPIDIQSYLLRVLEERVVYRLGANKGRPFSVTLVASTNRILKDEVKRGGFRQDLFYRISSVKVSIPPLRERGKDILLVADYFNQQMSELTNEAPLAFAPCAEKALLAYEWPGNVRELKNVVEQLHVLLPHREVKARDLPEEFLETGNDKKKGLPDILISEIEEHSHLDDKIVVAGDLESIEKQAIIQALADKKGNLSQVARQLGISRPTLYRKLELYNIKRYYS